jgi:DNA repair photolyase
MKCNIQYKEIKTNSLLKKITKKDKLFHGNYTVDPYQNCEFGCLYCDSSIDKTIYVKTNATKLLKKELEKITNGVIILGSVNDPYQNAEKNFKITRNLLNIIKQKNFSYHILTKSDLVLRDIDILSEIKKCFVTISIISINSNISKIFEKNVISTKNRFQTMKKLSDKGIKTGIAIIPILPFLVEDEFENIIKTAKKYKAKYIIHKSLELKGDQKNVFFDAIKNYRNDLVGRYENLFKDNYLPDKKYITKIDKKLDKLCQIYNLTHIHN